MKIVLDRNEMAEALIAYLTKRGYTVIGNPTLVVGIPTHDAFHVEATVTQVTVEEPRILQTQARDPDCDHCQGKGACGFCAPASTP